MKWALNPRGKLWVNGNIHYLISCHVTVILIPFFLSTSDESKIGQKLLEKMGWSKGKGLGATMQGNILLQSIKRKFFFYYLGLPR